MLPSRFISASLRENLLLTMIHGSSHISNGYISTPFLCNFFLRMRDYNLICILQANECLHYRTSYLVLVKLVKLIWQKMFRRDIYCFCLYFNLLAILDNQVFLHPISLPRIFIILLIFNKHTRTNRHLFKVWNATRQLIGWWITWRQIRTKSESTWRCINFLLQLFQPYCY